ncbi:MAG: ABC transporter permease subunit [bacterium]|nr:ABC transporter permease subunit [bacterium]
MRNIWTIFKKEWDRVIKDKRLVISVMILPGLMIFLIYTFIGTAMSSAFDNNPSRIAIVNQPDTFVQLIESLSPEDVSEYQWITLDQMEEYRLLIDQGEWEYLIEFPENFELLISSLPRPTVNVYYNPNEVASSSVHSIYQGYLYLYHQALMDVLFDDPTAFFISLDHLPVDENRQTGMMMSMLLPMLVVMFLFSGAMSIGPESIAGEKERGTIATLLITPVKRSHIAIGKIMSLSVLSLLSALSSFIGIISSLPHLLGGQNINMSIYGIIDYLQILFLLFSTVFVIVGIISVISAYAKNLKEAGTLITPIYILTILVGVSSMFGGGANQSHIMYLIPLYNTVQSLTAILTFDVLAWQFILVTVLANTLYLIAFIFTLNLMFQSEKIMFAK